MCKDARCKTCSNASTSYTLEGINLLEFCKASIVIYKMSCNVCNLSYISEISGELHLRNNSHRSDS